jgi:hypothetical protein
MKIILIWLKLITFLKINDVSTSRQERVSCIFLDRSPITGQVSYHRSGLLMLSYTIPAAMA